MTTERPAEVERAVPTDAATIATAVVHVTGRRIRELLIGI